MRVSVCQWVPASLAFLGVVFGLAGCSCGDTHVRDDAGAAVADSDLRVDAGGPSDYLCECCVGVSRLVANASECPAACAGLCEGADAGPPGVDAPSATCGERAVEVVCFDHVRAGEATSLEVTLQPRPDDCYCGQALRCEQVRIVGADPVIALESELCPETPTCRACEAPPVSTCALEAMPAGRTRVRINDEDAMDLVITPPDVMPERAAVCVRTAQIDSCGALWDPSVFTSDRACHPSAVRTGTRVTIDVEEACGGCAQIGPCEVMVLDDTIRVRPTSLPNSCEIACDPACRHDVHTCVTPPLEDGLYTVVVEGLVVTDDGPPSTIEVSSDGGLSTEVCRGSRT
ncbi:MAG: hypothetical protein J0L92_10560 [Deltaproteobacteria bacterium]|nr:hypothetical protein [Deltaproteobacteria bacterium]